METRERNVEMIFLIIHSRENRTPRTLRKKCSVDEERGEVDDDYHFAWSSVFFLWSHDQIEFCFIAYM